MGGYSPPPTPDPLNTILNSGTLGTIQSPIVIATIENAPLLTVNVSTIIAIGTIENAPLVTVEGALSASVEYPVVVSTIDNAPLVTVQGNVNVGTIDNAPLITVQGALSASVEYPVVVSTIDNAPLVTAQGSVTASLEYFTQPSTNGAVLGTVLSVGTVAVQAWTSTVLAEAFTVRNMPSSGGIKLPNVYVGNSTFQWFELESGAALTLEWVNPSSIYVVAAATGGTVFVIYSGA
jgi:hypothetical protein